MCFFFKSETTDGSQKKKKTYFVFYHNQSHFHLFESLMIRVQVYENKIWKSLKKNERMLSTKRKNNVQVVSKFSIKLSLSLFSDFWIDDAWGC